MPLSLSHSRTALGRSRPHHSDSCSKSTSIGTAQCAVSYLHRFKVSMKLTICYAAQRLPQPLYLLVVFIVLVP